MSRYTKGGYSVKELMEMPFEDYLLVRAAIEEIAKKEEEAVESATKGKSWKK